MGPSACPGSKSGWVLSLSHDNALHYSNLGNVNLQSLNHSVNFMVRIQEALFISITHTLLFSDSVLNLWETRTKCGESQLRRCHTVERVYMYVCVCVDSHVCPPVSPLSRFDGRTRAVEED